MTGTEVEDLRRTYPEGTRVELLEMDDVQAPPIGTLGTVFHVDDAGQIHVRWDKGGSLAVLPECDRIRKI